jgi:hypothetical protein
VLSSYQSSQSHSINQKSPFRGLLWCQSRRCLPVHYIHSHMTFTSHAAPSLYQKTPTVVTNRTSAVHSGPRDWAHTHPRLAACSRSEHSRPRPNRIPPLPLPLRLLLHRTNPCSDSRQEHHTIAPNQPIPAPTPIPTLPPGRVLGSARAEPLATLRALERHALGCVRSRNQQRAATLSMAPFRAFPQPHCSGPSSRWSSCDA